LRLSKLLNIPVNRIAAILNHYKNDGWPINYLANVTNNCHYFWSHNSVATKLNENIGFKKISINRTCWQVYLQH
jgi:hypothetical protein